MSDQPFYKVDPEDFTRTKEFLRSFILYESTGTYFTEYEIRRLQKVLEYLDIMSTKNWAISEG
jgi:hypothetical protein